MTADDIPMEVLEILTRPDLADELRRKLEYVTEHITSGKRDPADVAGLTITQKQLIREASR